jgi:hypothetical protein
LPEGGARRNAEGNPASHIPALAYMLQKQLYAAKLAFMRAKRQAFFLQRSKLQQTQPGSAKIPPPADLTL